MRLFEHFLKSVRLKALLGRARKYHMTDEEKAQQRISFAYGNANIDNPHVTREVVERAAEELSAKGGPASGGKNKPLGPHGCLSDDWPSGIP